MANPKILKLNGDVIRKSSPFCILGREFGHKFGHKFGQGGPIFSTKMTIRFSPPKWYQNLHRNSSKIENAKISTKFKIPFSPPDSATLPKSPLVSVLDSIFAEQYFRRNVSFLKKVKMVDFDLNYLIIRF